MKITQSRRDDRPTADEVFDNAEMIGKVKEPQPQEIGRFRPGQIVFTYFHFAADAGADAGMSGERDHRDRV